MERDYSKFRIGNKVEIDWIDSYSTSNQWILEEDIKSLKVKPDNITSIGFILDNNIDYITIVQNWKLTSTQYSGLTTIPKGCIKNITLLIPEN